METVLRFNDCKQKVILIPDYEVTEHADMSITVENVNPGDPDNPTYAFVTLKEHEAVFLAKEILRFVEMNRKDNVRWHEDEENRKNILYILNQLKGIAIYKEDKTAENCIDWLKSLKDKVQPQTKQEWSEQDEGWLDNAIVSCEQCGNTDTADWLKSLRPQKKQEWSKDDEILLEGIIGAVSNKKLLNKYQIEWLSNLSPQSHWKPSDEQIKALNEVLYFAANHENPHWNDYIFGTLNNLMRQLKKLREE